MSIPSKALLLCAGKSTRISLVAQGLPKPLIQLKGKSVLERNIEWLVKAGVKEFWINLHYNPEAIRSQIGDGARWGVCVHYIYEPEILGTAGGVRNIASDFQETFLAVYGDTLYRFSIEPFCAFHEQHKPSVSIALFDKEKQLHSGLAGGQVVLQGARIRQFIEGSHQIISSFVNAGVYLLEPEIMKRIAPDTFSDFGKDLFPSLLEENASLLGYIIDGYCLGIDTPESYERTLQLMENM